MENNKKNSEIFLGIVGVATLIVAIIGASFSYFIASASSADSAVNLTSYEFSSSLSLQPIYNPDAKLIPIDPAVVVEGADAPDNTNLAFAINGSRKDENDEDVKVGCLDDNGFKVCALYELTITNTGSEPISLQGSIVTEEATTFKNLMYREVTKRENGTYQVSDTAKEIPTVANGTVNIGEINVPANGGTQTVYALVYLNDNGQNQSVTDADAGTFNEMGATYKGKFVYTSTGTNGNRLTGTFKVS